MTTTTLTKGLRGLLLGLMAALALLSGTGTAHAYTDNEQNYLFQLGPSMLQVPSSDEAKLTNGYKVCADLKSGPEAIGVLAQQATLRLRV